MAVIFKPHRRAIPAPTVASADNGLSLSGTTVQLGQDIGAAGNPAQLLSDREIPMFGFAFTMIDGGLQKFLVDNANDIYALGDIQSATNGFAVQINDAAGTWYIGGRNPNANLLIADVGLTSNELFYLDSLSTPRFQVGNSAAGTSTLLNSSTFTASLELAEAASGDLSQLGDIVGGTAYLSVDPNGRRTNFFGNNGIRIMQDTTLIHTGIALANGAAANVGTLNTSPIAGNPTKWIKIDDNGTVRHVPAW